MAKPFRGGDEVASPSGENLKFDFNDENSEFDGHDSAAADPIADDHSAERGSSEWRVGDPDSDSSREEFSDAPPRANRANPPRDASRATAGEAPSAPRIRVRPPAPKKPKPAPDDEFVDEFAAPIYNHGVTHSARLILGLLAIVAVAYTMTTALIRSSPAAAADILSRLPVVGARFVMPITPARLVALRDVHADYLRTKDGHTGLVITGIAENVGQAPLHTVEIAVNLRDSTSRPVASRAVYCGNNLSAAMVAQMTPHELEFFQKLDPPKSFALDPSATAPFVIVFIDPPRTVSRFDVAIANAVRTEPAAPETTGS